MRVFTIYLEAIKCLNKPTGKQILEHDVRITTTLNYVYRIDILNKHLNPQKFCQSRNQLCNGKLTIRERSTYKLPRHLTHKIYKDQLRNRQKKGLTHQNAQGCVKSIETVKTTQFLKLTFKRPYILLSPSTVLQQKTRETRDYIDVPDFMDLDINIIYPRALRDTGSTVMRVFQTQQLLQQFSKNKYRLHTLPISSYRADIFERFMIRKYRKKSVNIFCKNAIDRISLSTRRWLHEGDNVICVDYLDKDMSCFDFSYIDLHIASSNTQFKFLQSMANTTDSKVCHVPHQADLRLLTRRKKETSSGKIYYFGEARNLYCPPEYLDRIELLPYIGKMSDGDIEKLETYQFQWCVRDPRQNRDLAVIKPITKVENAISLRQNPIIGFDQTDAIEIMGEEYPYIIRNYTRQGFQEIFEKIECRATMKTAQSIIHNSHKNRGALFYAKKYDEMIDLSLEILKLKNFKNKIQGKS